MTTLEDTLYYADGSLANGQVVVNWPMFQSNGTPVAAGQQIFPVVNGQIQIALYPNAAAFPTGTYYTAVFELEEGPVSEEYWIFPNQPVVTLPQVRVGFPPAPGLFVNTAQLTSSGAQSGQFLGWNGTQWVPMYISTLNISPNTIALAVTKTVAADIAVLNTPAVLGSTLTLNVPDAGASSRGVVTTGTQSFAGQKTFLGKLGVANAAPVYQLDVTGDINCTGALRVNGAPVLAGAWQAGSGGAIFYNGGNVGIGSSTPTSKLTVVSSAISPAIFYMDTAYYFGLNANQSPGNCGFSLAAKNSGGTAQIAFIIAAGGASPNLTIGAPNTGNLVLGNMSPSGGFNQYINIIDGGFTAIGQNITPIERLHVYGATVHDNITSYTTRPAVGTTRIAGEIWGGIGAGDAGLLRLSAGGGSSANRAYIDISGYSGAADLEGTIVFGTRSVERMRLNTTGLGIGTATPTYKLHVTTGRAMFQSNDAYPIGLTSSDGAKVGWIYMDTSGSFGWTDSGGNLLLQVSAIGSVTATNKGSGGGQYGFTAQNTAVGSFYPFVGLNYQGSQSVGHVSYFRTSRGTAAAPTALQAGDIIYVLYADGYDGSGFSYGAGQIQFSTDGNWSTTSHPTAIEFATCAMGATTPGERMRLTSSGLFLIGNTIDDSSGRKLQVYNSGVSIYTNNDGAEGLRISRYPSGVYYSTLSHASGAPGESLVIKVGDGATMHEGLRVATTGFVSIGAPANGAATPLYVNCTQAAQTPSLTSFTGSSIAFYATSTVHLLMSGQPSPPYGWWLQCQTMNGSYYPILLNPMGGAVGIGKATQPAYALDVVGDINCTGAMRINGTPVTGGTPGTWSTYTPTVTASGAMTPTSLFASYLVYGTVLFLQVSFVVSPVSGTSLTISLPTTVLASNMTISAWVLWGSGTANQCIQAVANGANIVLTITNPGGSSCAVYVGGSLRIS